jgi:hypothetical protein
LDSPRGPGARRILSSAVILAAIFALSLAGLRPPSPKSGDAPATEFSASRALDTLHRVLATDAPHPVGSPADAAMRDRIMDELTKLGYAPQVQTGFACSYFGICAAVNNVVARLDGSEPGSAVLLAAHYDSVPAGPGASDDGVGVAAVLEIARALKSLPTPRNSVILLIDDGEEAGSLGARAFVDAHPWAKEVRAAVNLDARGTSGPSLMFETASANDWAVRLYARSAARPAASSIFYDVYKRLPSDTDFTVFKAAGYQGLNFAFIGGEPQYHTPLDNSANVTPASLQHQGENALPSVLALANADLTAPPQREAVFFDVFERWTIVWPARRTLDFALGAMALLLAQILWMLRSKRLSIGELVWGLMAWLVTMGVTAALALILARVIRLAGAMQVNWVAHPLPIELAFWSLAVATVITNAIFFTRRAGFWGVWTGVWAWWTLLSAVIAWRAPALSYIVLAPGIIAVLVALPATTWRSDSTLLSGLATALPLAAAAIVGFSPAVLLYAALGNRGLVLISAVVGLLLTPIAPLCADLRGVPGLRGFVIPWVPIWATGLAAFAAVVVPAYSAKAPERVNIEYWQDADSGMSQWIVQPGSGHLSEPIRLATTFKKADGGAFPWDNAAAFVSDAPHLDLAPPTFTILESSQGDGRRNYRTLLRSERGAPGAALLFPPGSDVEDVRVEGQPVEPELPRIRQYFNGWAVYRCPALPASGIQISFSVPQGKTVEVAAADQSYGLPAEGTFLLKARPLTAAPSQNGDVTIISRRVQLFP